MDQPHDLSALLDRLREILTTQSLPSTTTTSKSPSHILPLSIPPLPPNLSTLPPKPQSLTTLTELLTTHILPNLSFSSLSSHYYGFVTGGATPAALLADFLTSIYDQNLSVHLPAESLATSLEVAALNLLVQLFNLPNEWRVGTTGSGGGIITTGATASNVVGLACAREWVVREAYRRLRSSANGTPSDAGGEASIGQLGLLSACQLAGITNIQILSTLPHSSISKAASIVGIGRNNVIDISSSDSHLSIDIAKFKSLASSMRAEGKAYILAISAGEVNTGHFATDLATMRQLRSICDEHGIWIHVDGAFGLFGRVLMSHETSTSSPSEGEDYSDIISGVSGLELADSITGDGHKLLNVPYDSGIFFTRHKHISEDVFQNGNAAYLVREPVDGGADTIQSPMNIGVENSRRFRALPVWATLMAYGREGYVDMLRRQIGLARRVRRWMEGEERVVVLPREEGRGTFMVVLFRARDEVVNRELVRRINGTGKIYVTGTKWDGLPAARIAVSNWQVDVERDFEIIKDVLESVL